MQAERQREAAEFRAEGEGAARRIRGTADREVTVIKADATGESERIRGDGDAERNRIFAEAFGQDPDFFGFYRSMQAYEGASSERYAVAADPDASSSSISMAPAERRLRQAADPTSPPGTLPAPRRRCHSRQSQQPRAASSGGERYRDPPAQ